MKKDKYNVVQWSSGNVGKASIKGIKDRDDLNLSGLIVNDNAKNGLDAVSYTHLTLPTIYSV